MGVSCWHHNMLPCLHVLHPSCSQHSWQTAFALTIRCQCMHRNAYCQTTYPVCCLHTASSMRLDVVRAKKLKAMTPSICVPPCMACASCANEDSTCKNACRQHYMKALSLTVHWSCGFFLPSPSLLSVWYILPHKDQSTTSYPTVVPIMESNTNTNTQMTLCNRKVDTHTYIKRT